MTLLKVRLSEEPEQSTSSDPSGECQEKSGDDASVSAMTSVEVAIDGDGGDGRVAEGSDCVVDKGRNCVLKEGRNDVVEEGRDARVEEGRDNEGGDRDSGVSSETEQEHHTDECSPEKGLKEGAPLGLLTTQSSSSSSSPPPSSSTASSAISSPLTTPGSNCDDDDSKQVSLMKSKSPSPSLDISSTTTTMTTATIKHSCLPCIDQLLNNEERFNIYVHSPGIDPIQVQIGPSELVQEIVMLLTDKEETCHKTCFSLHFNGQMMDYFQELKTFEGLKEGSCIKMVDEAYSFREARFHVRHIRELLKSLDMEYAYQGKNTMSLSFLSTITSGDFPEKRRSGKADAPCTDHLPPEYVLPGDKEHPLVPLHPYPKDKNLVCVKVLTTSGWNPPPSQRKMRGDLLYLLVLTLEGKRFHITASTKGFYINQCTDDDFDPTPAAQKCLCHTLPELLSQVSSSFKKNFTTLIRKRGLKHVYERVSAPYQVYSWCSPSFNHSLDSIRAEDRTFFSSSNTH